MSDLVTIGFRANTGDLKQAQVELDKTAKAGDRVDGSVKRTSAAFRVLGGTIAALGLAGAARETIQYADSWKSLNTQLKLVTNSEQELLSVRQQLLDISEQTPSDLATIVDVYSNLYRSTKDLGVSQADLLKTTKTINNLFLAGGASADAMKNALVQLGQGLAAGALRGDEFNSVAEQAPRIMDALSEHLSMTRGELRAFAAEGGITAEIMLDALGNYSGAAQALADKVEKTFGQSMVIAKNNMVEFVGESESINTSIALFGETILSATGNLEALTNAALAASGVYAASLVPSVVRYTAAQGAA